MVIKGGSKLTTVRSQKYAKSCCHKTTWAIIIMTPQHLLEASDYCMWFFKEGLFDTEAAPSKHSIDFDKWIRPVAG